MDCFQVNFGCFENPTKARFEDMCALEYYKKGLKKGRWAEINKKRKYRLNKSGRIREREREIEGVHYKIKTFKDFLTLRYATSLY